MEGLIKKIEEILDTYFRDCVGNRVNQWSFRTFKQVILGEIANYKPSEKVNKVVPLRPIVKETIKEDKK